MLFDGADIINRYASFCHGDRSLRNKGTAAPVQAMELLAPFMVLFTDLEHIWPGGWQRPMNFPIANVPLKADS
jgi:hypothetical protein